MQSRKDIISRKGRRQTRLNQYHKRMPMVKALLMGSTLAAAGQLAQLTDIPVVSFRDARISQTTGNVPRLEVP